MFVGCWYWNYFGNQCWYGLQQPGYNLFIKKLEFNFNLTMFSKHKSGEPFVGSIFPTTPKAAQDNI